MTFGIPPRYAAVASVVVGFIGGLFLHYRVFGAIMDPVTPIEGGLVIGMVALGVSLSINLVNRYIRKAEEHLTENEWLVTHILLIFVALFSLWIALRYVISPDYIADWITTVISLIVCLIMLPILLAYHFRQPEEYPQQSLVRITREAISFLDHWFADARHIIQAVSLTLSALLLIASRGTPVLTAATYVIIFWCVIRMAYNLIRLAAAKVKESILVTVAVDFAILSSSFLVLAMVTFNQPITALISIIIVAILHFGVRSAKKFMG